MNISKDKMTKNNENITAKQKKSSHPIKPSLKEFKEKFAKKMQNQNDGIALFDPLAKSEECLNVVLKKTGLIYDTLMNEHFSTCAHIENPERLNCILKRLEEENLFTKCQSIPSIFASEEEIQMVHSESYVQFLKETPHEKLLKLATEKDTSYFNKKTFDAALLSAGCSMELTRKVLNGDVQNGLALVRPPGHHASRDDFSGFCFFNNAALSAQLALNSGLTRILIVDWDVHHGQGTQRIFYQDPRVLYFSMHRYEDGMFWPHLRESNWDYVGNEKGRGFNINVPLNRTFLKNEDVLAVFHQILLPVAYEFNPELIIISSGFDAAIGCEEGMMMWTPSLYAHLTSMLMGLANSKLVVLLEGGYCLESLAESCLHTLRALTGLPCPKLIAEIGPISESMRRTLKGVISSHQAFWKCFSGPLEGKEGLQAVEDFVFKGLDSPEGKPPPVYPDCRLQFTPEEIQQNNDELLRLRQATCMKSAPNRVCLGYDSDMEKHFNVWDKKYPECPERTSKIISKLSKYKILDRTLKLKSCLATEFELGFVHDPNLIEILRKSSEMTPRERKQMGEEFNSVYFNEHTWNSARLATGNLLQAVRSVCEGQSRSGVAVIRPPGHHAEVDQPHGFCFFNNVCVAAKYAIKKYSLRRILILDWDVHHGNGIQHCFEDSSSVLYISIHMYRNAKFFPYSEDADASHVGVGPGRGFNVNVPWSMGSMGDGDYIAAFTRIVMPIAYQFDPDLVLVSAGFDAAVNDPIGGCRVTPECFGHMTHLLGSLANGKLILALEGGYNLSSISNSMAVCVKALLGDPIPPLEPELCASESALRDIEDVVIIQKQFWSCLTHDISVILKSPNDDLDGTNVSSNLIESICDADFSTPPESPSDLSIPRSDILEKTPNLNLKDEMDCLLRDFSALSTKDAIPPSLSHAGNEEVGAVGYSSPDCFDTQGFQNEGDELFAVVPLPWCEHLLEVQPLPPNGVDIENSSCEACGSGEENWLCLVCYKVLCGRYVSGHMVDHGVEEKHNLVLSFSDLSAWCYSCGSYVHHEILREAKGSAYMSKFGEEMP